MHMASQLKSFFYQNATFHSLKTTRHSDLCVGMDSGYLVFWNTLSVNFCWALFFVRIRWQKFLFTFPMYYMFSVETLYYIFIYFTFVLIAIYSWIVTLIIPNSSTTYRNLLPFFVRSKHRLRPIFIKYKIGTSLTENSTFNRFINISGCLFAYKKRSDVKSTMLFMCKGLWAWNRTMNKINIQCILVIYH